MKGHEMASHIVDQHRVQELLTHDSSTGVFRWRTTRGGKAKAGSPAGTKDSHGHIQIKIDRKLYLAHRLTFLYETGRWPENEVDHINGVRDDNRRSNLREATKAQNMRNRVTGANNTSGHTGVSYVRHLEKWFAYISVDRKRVPLGYFHGLADAVLARKEAERAYFGEFARSSPRRMCTCEAQ